MPDAHALRHAPAARRGPAAHRGGGLRLRAAWRAVLAVLVLGGAQGVPAADPAALQAVAGRVQQAAAPWCGRWTELDSQGVRHCVLRVQALAAPGADGAFSFLDGAMLTEALVQSLSPPALAAVLGHEIAHFVLAHGRLRLQDAAVGDPQHQALLDFALPQAHEGTPRALPQQELDADALGLILAGMAGYPVLQSLRLWQTHLPALGLTAQATATHPATAVRAEAAADLARRWCAALRADRRALPLPDRLLPAADYRRDEVVQQQQRLDLATVCAGAPAPARRRPTATDSRKP